MEPTLSEIWDCIVVGAGPAGSVAAREIARRGRKVLLLDKATFPRRKVCGCCLNQSALTSLQSIGLGSLTADCQAVPLEGVRLASSGREVDLSLPGGVALSRDVLDVALIQEAELAGVDFRSGVTAKLGPREGDFRTVEFNGQLARTRLVIAADGLNSSLLQNERDKPILRADSRIGAGVIVRDFPSFYEPGRIFMAGGSGGYVGLVQVENEQLDLAAAFDPEFVRNSGGLGQAAELTLQQSGFPSIVGLANQPWKGTPALTRSPQQLAGERWFAIGDAAGYVEPFTGEGMAWAMASGIAVTELATQPWQPSLIPQWEKLHKQLIRSRQQVCRILAEVLRRPWLCSLSIRTLRHFPKLANPILAKLNKSTFSLPGVPHP
jgi:menaquinone-9 beta-reductase